jgi:hypothetical protein
MVTSSLRAFSPSHLLLVGCLFAILAPSVWAQGEQVCAASPQVQAALVQIPAFQPADQSQYQWVLARQTALQSLMRRYPDNVFVERAYIDSMQLYNSDAAKAVAEYKARHDEQPENAPLTYLYGRTLVRRNTPQAIKLFDEVLEKAPNFFLPHLDLVMIYTSPNFFDNAHAISHVKAFLAACPTALEGYRSLAQVDDKISVAQYTPKLRQILEPRTDPAAFTGYITLWSLEFKVRPSSEDDVLRSQISSDVTRIRALNLENVFEWWDALAYGYKLAGDTKESEWAKNGRQTWFPLAREEPSSEERWAKTHPRPNRDAPFDEKQAHDRQLLQQSADWIKQRPNTLSVWRSRLAAMEDLEEVPASEVQDCVNRMLELAQADAGPNPIDSDIRLELAAADYERKLSPHQEVEMARKGLEELEAETQQPPYDLFYGQKELEELNFYRAGQKTQLLFYEANGYVRLQEPNDATVTLAQLYQALLAMKAAINSKDDRRKSYAQQESHYWSAMAHLAQLQNRKLDAMAYYESALLDRLDSGSLFAPSDKDNLADDARDLWASLGGTDEGWQSWYGERAAALANETHLTWETAQDPLPPFKLTDLQGKTWQLADLKGKVVFLNFWASW